ncbi:RING-type domain-containing protein [Meloidogyne graminicola]|uniref:RING-type domain-containing protein n=1 Tax=Meloidogyne graminicola TaxID=189291 RepID=A0A8S9ZB05_9BILA|nr:RING-type domain-containing protein [Meloidogyne graminicola]
MKKQQLIIILKLNLMEKIMFIALKKINFSTTLYFEGTDEYNKLYECTKIIWVVTAYEVDKNGSHGKEIKFDSNLIENKEVCSVCITKFASGNDVNITPCNHIFHIDCIETW